MVTRRIRSDGDERGMLVYGYSLPVFVVPKAAERQKGGEFSNLVRFDPT
jgi:hypothetical protein